MVDLKRIREQPEEVKAGLRKKRADPELIDQALRADRRRRELVHEVETLRAAQNKASQEIARLAGAAREERIEEMKRLAGHLKTIEPELQAADADLETVLLRIPNLPHPEVPDGGPDDAVTLREVGAPPAFDFAPRQPPRDRAEESRTPAGRRLRAA